MPILKPEAPQASLEALHANLSGLAGRAAMLKTAPKFAAILSSSHSLARPGLSYPVYTLVMTDLVAGAGLVKARLTSWRHEFTHADEVVSAEVSSGRRPKFVRLDVSSKARSMQHELQTVAAGEVFASRAYELRLLQMSSVGLRALWLRAGSGSRSDIVVPLGPTRRELTANHHYAPNEFITAIKAAAESMLAADALGKGG